MCRHIPHHFIVVQIHQLNDETRGPTVEAIVSRMKTIRSSLAATQSAGGSGDGGPMLRFMAISATIPNIEDVSQYFSQFLVTPRVTQVTYSTC